MINIPSKIFGPLARAGAAAFSKRTPLNKGFTRGLSALPQDYIPSLRERIISAHQLMDDENVFPEPTPLVKINIPGWPERFTFLAKLESNNLTGSFKERGAFNAIYRAKKDNPSNRSNMCL